MSHYSEEPPTPDELHELVEDVWYEHHMLEAAQAALEDFPLGFYFGQADQPPTSTVLTDTRNAWVEVFLLHLRNLIDFYSTTAPRKDDITAQHYVQRWDPSSPAHGGTELDWLREMDRSMNKRVAHLTAYRQRVNKTVDMRLVADVADRLAIVHDRWWNMLADEHAEAYENARARFYGTHPDEWNGLGS